MLRRPGRTLAQGKGIAPFARAISGAGLSRALAFGLPGITLVAALGATWIGLSEPTLAGLSVEARGSHVQSVDPASLAWQAGIRPGQQIIEAEDALAPGGWSIVTSDGPFQHAVRASALRLSMRLGLVSSAAAIVVGAAALVAMRRRRRRAELFGTLGVVLSWLPLAASHDLVLGPWLGALAGPLIALWILRWVGPMLGWLALASAVILDAIWFALRVTHSPLLADIDAWRFGMVALGGIAIIAASVGMTWRSVARYARALRDADVVALITLLSMVVVLQILVDPPLAVPAALLVMSVIVYGKGRAALRGWADRALFAEERERSSIESAEAERARLSRELHDEPLQALVGVIRSLEDQPGTEREQDSLRGIAEQLRHLASNLHPPILDDLGLQPAVESLFAETGPVPVMLELDNRAGFARVERPPFDVELAVYRIIQEAATNALRHSGCQQIVVRGRISPEAIAIQVVDDGCGIRDGAVDAALRNGHLGMALMRRRAEAIDANLVHEATPGTGTTISLRWSR